MRNQTKARMRRRTTIPPATAPPMIPPLLLLPPLPLPLPADVEVEVEPDPVDDGLFVIVEAGELLVMHEVLLEFWIVKRSVDPPVRPWASKSATTTLVPARMSAFQLYDVAPVGTVKMNVEPKGIRPTAVNGKVAPVKSLMVHDSHCVGLLAQLYV